MARTRFTCTSCGRFVPVDFVAIEGVGDYGGPPYEDITLCGRCGGPEWSSRAGQVASGRNPDTGLSEKEEAEIKRMEDSRAR